MFCNEIAKNDSPKLKISGPSAQNRGHAFLKIWACWGWLAYPGGHRGWACKIGAGCSKPPSQEGGQNLKQRPGPPPLNWHWVRPSRAPYCQLRAGFLQSVTLQILHVKLHVKLQFFRATHVEKFVKFRNFTRLHVKLRVKLHAFGNFSRKVRTLAP